MQKDTVLHRYYNSYLPSLNHLTDTKTWCATKLYKVQYRYKKRFLFFLYEFTSVSVWMHYYVGNTILLGHRLGVNYISQVYYKQTS